MKKYSVLICDDNMAIHRSMTTYLKAEGIDVISAYDGETALRELRRQDVDVVVLDVMLPGMDGYDTCREIRKFSDVHIIMLSARGDEMDRIIGLEVGADDYVSNLGLDIETDGVTYHLSSEFEGTGEMGAVIDTIELERNRRNSA